MNRDRQVYFKASRYCVNRLKVNQKMLITVAKLLEM